MTIISEQVLSKIAMQWLEVVLTSDPPVIRHRIYRYTTKIINDSNCVQCWGLSPVSFTNAFSSNVYNYHEFIYLVSV